MMTLDDIMQKRYYKFINIILNCKENISLTLVRKIENKMEKWIYNYINGISQDESDSDLFEKEPFYDIKTEIDLDAALEEDFECKIIKETGKK